MLAFFIILIIIFSIWLIVYTLEKEKWDKEMEEHRRNLEEDDFRNFKA